MIDFVDDVVLFDPLLTDLAQTFLVFNIALRWFNWLARFSQGGDSCSITIPIP
jgi:hypothetical protein